MRRPYTPIPGPAWVLKPKKVRRSFQTLSGESQAHGACRTRRRLYALLACASRL
jgi:hypothetical protein